MEIHVDTQRHTGKRGYGYMHTKIKKRPCYVPQLKAINRILQHSSEFSFTSMIFCNMIGFISTNMYSRRIGVQPIHLQQTNVFATIVQ